MVMAPSPAPRRPQYHNNINNTGTDRIVWMATSPLLSPARDKKPKRKPAQRSSILSFRGRGKEGEEPTSPKVSCMGRVRNQGKSLGKSSGFENSFQNRAPRSRTEDSFPGVSQETQKGEKSCFSSLFCDLPSLFGPGPGRNSLPKNGGDVGNGLFSEPDIVTGPIRDRHVLHTHPSSPRKDQNIVFRRSNSSGHRSNFEGFCDVSGFVDNHHSDSCQQKRHESINELESAKHTDAYQCKSHEGANDVPHLVSPNHADAFHHESTQACGTVTHSESAKHRIDELGHLQYVNNFDSAKHSDSFQPKSHEMISGSCDKRIDKACDVADKSHERLAEQVLKCRTVYEDLPSLQSKRSPDSNLMVSCEVVPETWLPPDVDSVKQRRASRRSRKNGRGNSADEILNALAMANLPISYEHSQMSATSDHASAVTMNSEKRCSNARLINCDSTCEMSQNHAVGIEDTSFINSDACQSSQFGSLQTHNKHVAGGSATYKHKESLSWRLSGLSKWLQVPTLYKKSLSKGEDCFSLSLQRVDFKNLRALPPQFINTLIFVGYNVNNGQLNKLSNDDLHFQSPVKWLRSETGFIRSLSATTCRTVIQLQRCNSDPCRASS